MEIDDINKLIKSQENDCFEIDRIWANIKKDGEARKTKTYIDDRRAKLNSIYLRALSNHKVLEEQELLSTHKYFTLNYFNMNIQRNFDAAMEHLAAHETKLKTDKNLADIRPMTSAQAMADQDQLDNARENSKTHPTDQDNLDNAIETSKTPKLFVQNYRLNQLKKRLSTAQTAIIENKPVWHLQFLTKTLEKQFQEIEDNHVHLLMEPSVLDDEYFTDNHFLDAQEQFDSAMEALQDKINENNRQNYKTPSTKLPRITIPYFTGSYESWNSFYDLFKKIIDEDSSISTTEKMQYLKTHVRGDAEKLIKHLTVNEVNYKAALTLLINRYKDERLVSQTFIDKILDLPKIQTANAKMLRNMHDCINESLEALKNQNIDITTWDPILCRLVSRKWDSETNMKYEDQLSEPNKLQDFGKLMKFLEKRFKSLESSKPATQNQTLTSTTYNRNYEKPSLWQEKKGSCWYCSNEHNIHQCQAFKALNVNDRVKNVQDKQMCLTCLMHDAKKQCVSQKYKKCDICNKAHATLLHRNVNEYLTYKTQQQYNNNNNKNTIYVPKPTTSKPTPARQPHQESPIRRTCSHTHNDNTQKTVLLATALVQATAFDGTTQLLRVLCDQGSEVSLCTEETAQLLGLPRQKIKADIKGIADDKPKTSNYKIDVTLKPRFSSNYKLQTSLIVLPKLTGSLPKQNLQQLENKNIENKVIADPTYNKRGPIDIILGAEDYSKLLLQGFQKLDHGIIAQNTELGWIFSGLCLTEGSQGMKMISLVTRTEDVQLSKFWELEEVTEEYQMKNDDVICENIYNNTTQRHSDGTYTVRIPFKDSSLEYGNTRQKAAARLLQLEKKLEKDSDLRKQYNDFMNEYLEMGHMIKINKANYNEGKFYIPHQPVIREGALTTKLRCVFDASSKSKTNVSLNDNLYKGPRLQQDLANILLRWRKHRFVFKADVEKMYRFIKIHEDDYTYQRILWRWTPKQMIEEYALTTVTYGTTCAPYLAIKTLQQLAKDEQHNFPMASKVALEDFYVDDILSGGNDLKKTKKLQTQLIEMLRAGGFNLRKWSSNSAELLENIPSGNIDVEVLWWNDPKWLQEGYLIHTKTIPETCEEVRSCHQTSVEIKNENDIFKRFSSFQKMVRVLSYCLRFIRRQKADDALTLEEIDKTTKQIILQVQKETFDQEYKKLKKGQPLSKGNKLSCLDPFVDEFELIRVGGRLHKSELPYDQKHPILLPYDHHVTTKTIRNAHEKTLHGGNRLTLSYLRQKYWVLSGKRKVKCCINKCVKCIRYKAEAAEQKMGILPRPRVTQSFTFSHTGCDYAGPIQVRAMKGRGHKSYKGYIAIFVCLATKAIHLELVGDLSTESFIAALRRFMARRGPVSHMYSDNGTNFVGAANYLYKELLDITQSPQFQREMTNIGIQWHFSPPAAPHFGGIWESGVKSIKHHLKRVIGDTTLTFEELSTYLTQIEACLNSRPLCIQTENINDNIILTPSHFLIGREAVGIPDPMIDTNTDLINRWKHIQKMKKDFWNSWTKEYLHELQQRYKWKSNEENLKIGTVVLIKDSNVSPSKWPLAKIKEIHPGSDGATRVVTLERSQGADQKRSIHSLIPLPVNEDLESTNDKAPIKNNIATCRIKNNNCRKSKGRTWFWWMTIMMTILCTSAAASYTNKNLDPGLYIEQMGNATLDRGTFRVETHYERRILEEKLKSTKDVLYQFNTLCKYATSIDSKTHCNQYYDHLQEEIQKFEKTYEYLTEINHTRKKRGLMGQVMTAIFGVNDGVYKDIEKLQNNQQMLIDAANHQTKFMISTITTVNETEERIYNKLERFQTKLNQVTAYLKDNNRWYKQINSNIIQLQVLQSYQLAYNYITEIIDYYSGIVEIYISKATVYSVLNPKHVSDIIKDANKKLPSNLKIIQTQLIDTRLSENETHIRVLAYFPIAEKAKYTLVHITPIPKKNEDGSFQSLNIRQLFVGVDYNNEKYFELTHEEFKSCLHRLNDFICFPVAVKNMQLNKNCIVRLITKNENSTDCPSISYNITSNILWKQVQMTNTWLYLTKRTETVSIVCDGQRQEISIHDVGIIQISENCIIKTITTTLTAKRIITSNVLASFSKKSDFKLDNNRSLLSYQTDISKEQVLDNSRDIFNHLKTNENLLQTTLDNTVWSSVSTQTYVYSFSTVITCIIIILLIYCFGPQMMQRLRAMLATRRTWRPASHRAPEPDQPPSSSAAPRPAAAAPTPASPAYARPARRLRPQAPAPPHPQLYELKTFPGPAPERRQNVHVQ